MTEVGTAVGHVVAGFFIVLFATYFFLADGGRIWAWLVRLAPRAAREHVDGSGRVAWISLTQFVRATVLVALADAIGVMIVAAILGVPFVLAIGVLVFLGAFIPMVGATVAGTVAILVALVDQGPITALLMLGGVILVQQIEGHILQPFLMGRFVSVHPLGVIVAIGCGVLVAGIAGALIAVPLVAAGNAVVNHLAREQDPEDYESPVTTDDEEQEVEEGLDRDPRTTRHHDAAGRPIRTTRNTAVTDQPTGPVTLADIEAAREVLADIAVRTPMEESRWLSALAGGPVSLKCENLQRTGSFKIRGAYVRISRLSRRGARAGVVAASAGNHAQGVALAAQHARDPVDRLHARRARRSPRRRPPAAYGADVRFHGRYLDDALVEARRFAEETGAVLIHPFDHPDIVAGQGTAGLEVLEQAPDVRTVVVPTGGGGLLAGIAIAIKAARPTYASSACRPRAPPPSRSRCAAGSPVPLPSMTTMADGIAVGRPGDITFAAVQEHCDDIITVSEESLSRALLALVERAKMVVEPAGRGRGRRRAGRPDRLRDPGRGRPVGRQHRPAAAAAR